MELDVGLGSVIYHRACNLICSKNDYSQQTISIFPRLKTQRKTVRRILIDGDSSIGSIPSTIQEFKVDALQIEIIC